MLSEFGCRCGDQSTSIYHYFTNCNLIMDDIEYLDYIIKNYIPTYTQPSLPCTIIDYLLNNIPQSFKNMHKSHWKHTWPLILKITFKVEKLSNPQCTIEEEPNPGEILLSKQ